MAEDVLNSCAKTVVIRCAFCTLSDAIFPVQLKAFVGERPQLFEGAEHQVAVFENPAGFPSHNPEGGSSFPTLHVEPQVNAQAPVAFFDTYNGDTYCEGDSADTRSTSGPTE